MKDSRSLKRKQKKHKKRRSKSSAVIPQEIKIDSAVKTGSTKFVDSIILFIPVLFLLLFLVLHYLNLQTLQKIKEVELKPVNFALKLSDYPILNKYTAPSISAESAIIMEAQSQTVLYSKNADIRFSQASVSKLMTALVASEYYKENSVLTIYTPIVEGSNIGFTRGEQYLFKDLLYALLLPSSNEAAYALTQNYPGGTDAFIARMNEKASLLNLKNTGYADPAGLNDDRNYSTVNEIAKLSSEVIKNPLIAKVAGTKYYTINDITGSKEIRLENLNRLLGTDGVNGLKTGTTEAAGQVLVTTKLENEFTFIIVVMRSMDRFEDTRILISLIKDNVRFIKPRLPADLVTN